MNVPLECVLLETDSKNIIECITNSHKMLKRLGLKIKSIILVHLPFMERLLLLTFLQAWPGEHAYLSHCNHWHNICLSFLLSEGQICCVRRSLVSKLNGSSIVDYIEPRPRPMPLIEPVSNKELCLH